MNRELKNIVRLSSSEIARVSGGALKDREIYKSTKESSELVPRAPVPKLPIPRT